MIIKSSAALSDYAAISNLAHERQEPIYITQYGEGDLVVMSIEAFERREQLSKLKAVLDEKEQERLSGVPMVSLKEVRERLGKKYADNQT